METPKTQRPREHIETDLRKLYVEASLHSLYGYYDAGGRFGRLQYEPGKSKRLQERAKALQEELTNARD